MTRRADDRSTHRLLVCGVVAGPLFLFVYLVQAVTRDGFDPAYHPLSLLSLGGAGWVQITSFVVTGTLYVACAAGMRRVLRPGRASRWGPALVGLLGAGLIVAGVFVTDAGAGFPAGAPAGAPEVTWHGALHGAGAVVAFNGMVIGCLVFARRFAAERRWVALAAAVSTALAVFLLTTWPDPDGMSVRLVVASAVLFAFVGGTAGSLLRTTGGSGRMAG